MKKGTKLTDTPKDYMQRTRMDKEIAEKLDFIANHLGISRLEAVRRGIEEQFFKLREEE